MRSRDRGCSKDIQDSSINVILFVLGLLEKLLEPLLGEPVPVFAVGLQRELLDEAAPNLQVEGDDEHYFGALLSQVVPLSLELHLGR